MGTSRAQKQPGRTVGRRGPAPAVGGDASDALLEAIRSANETLRQCAERVQKKLRGSGEYDSTLASHLSWLTKNAASTLDAVRKMEAATWRSLEDMGREDEMGVVKAWCEELSAQERAELVAHLRDIDGENRMLS